jgi:hypothetical protein
MFELQRVQTRSMQIDNPILLSLCFKEAGDKEESNKHDKPFDTETESAPSDSTMMTPPIANLLLPPGCIQAYSPTFKTSLGLK